MIASLKSRGSLVRVFLKHKSKITGTNCNCYIWCVFRVKTPLSNFSSVIWTVPKKCMKTSEETMLWNNTVPWKLYTRLMLLRMIMAEHFHLKRSGTDVIYEIPCCHDSNLQMGIMKRKWLKRLAEGVRGGVFKPVKVKMFGLQPEPVTVWRNSAVQELWSW